MDPQIALQILLTLAKITGALMSMFLAIVIFALRDDDLAEILLSSKIRGRAPLVAMFLTIGLLSLVLVITLFLPLSIEMTRPYEGTIIIQFLAIFIVALFCLFLFFGVLLSEKWELMKEDDSRRMHNRKGVV